MAKIRQSNLDNSVIIGNAELAETAAANDILLVYDTSSGTIKKILSSNIGVQAPTFTSVSPTNVNTGDGTGNATFTITGTNFDATVTAKLRTTAGVEVNFDSVTRDSSTQITGVIAISSLSNANEPYDVIIVNGSNLQVIANDQININAQPVYVTASGSLGEQLANTAGSFSVNATDPESAGNVTFELQSGSLPPGYSITNTAAEGGTAIISGTDTVTSSATTFNFTLRAVDAASNTTSRAFSIRTTVPITESFTSSGTFSVPSGITQADVLVVAGGGGGGGGGGRVGPPGDNGSGGGAGGAGGLIFVPNYPLTPGGTVTVTVGCGGPGPNASGVAGQDSVFGTLTAKGGGGGGVGDSGAGGPGGSGGGGGGGQGLNGTPGSATQPTQPGQSGAYGFGNAGGGGNGGDYQSGGAGGGGASTSGANAAFVGGPGGDGRAYTISDGTTPVYYSGGGGGGGGHIGGGGNTPAPGGQGGGGNGGAAPAGGGQPGQTNKGGGGGGGAQSPSGSAGSTGGKGIVIVRY